MDEAKLISVLSGEGINLSEVFFPKLKVYAELLSEWNEKMNLTAITDPETVYEKHFLDCLLLLKNRDLNNKEICDLGSGAGFPGMLLALAVPSAKITLVDATRKKFLFLEEVPKALQIPNVEFHIYCAMVLVTGFIAIFPVVVLGCLAKMGIYKLLCMLTRK